MTSLKSSRLSRFILAFVISSGLIGAVLAQLDIANFLRRIANADIEFIGLAAGLYTAVFIVRGIRFWVLTPSSGLGIVTAAIAVQSWAIKFTPFRLGELALPYLLARHGRQPIAGVLITLVQVRLLDLWMLGCMSLIAIVALRPGDFTGRSLILTFGVVLISVLLLKFRAWMRVNLTIGRKLAELMNFGRFTAVQKGLCKIEEAIQVSSQFRKGQLTIVGASTIAMTLLNFLFYFCIFRSFDIEIGFAEVVIGSSIAQIGAALPLTTVGSIGTLETAWIAGFMMVGIEFSEAALTGIASQITTMAFSCLLAIPSYLYLLSGSKYEIEDRAG